MNQVSTIELLRNVNPKLLGYGPPSHATQQLIADGFIEISVQQNGRWSAILTDAGEARLRGLP